MRKLVTTLALPLLLVTGCASVGGETGALPDPEEYERFTRTVGSTSRPDQIYRVLLAEIAGRRGRPDVALQQYMILAQDIPDPRLAERAVQIGFYTGQYEAILPAARRWVELEPERAEAQRSLALSLVQVGEDDAAVALFLDWLGEDPDQSEQFATVSGVLQRVDDPERVNRILSALQEARPNSANIQHAYALSNVRTGNLGAALEATERTLELKPGTSQAVLLRAQILVQEGRVDEAVAFLEQQFEDYPENYDVGLGYARLLLQEGRTEEARQKLEALAAQQPDKAEVLFAVGMLASQAGELDLAEKNLRGAADVGGERPDIFFELGRIAERREAYEEALDWYGQVKGGQQELDAQVRAGYVLVQLRRFSQASNHFKRLRRDNAETAVRLYLAESEAFRDIDQPDRGLALLNEGLDEHPGDHDLLYARALLAERLDRLDVLEGDLRQILVTDPDNAHALNALGYTLADRTTRYDEAYQYIERALQLMPDDAAILDSMGWVLYRLERFDEALEYLQKAYKVTPDEEIAAHLGEVFWVMGQRERAMDVWNAELERLPEAPRVKQTMQRFGI